MEEDDDCEIILDRVGPCKHFRALKNLSTLKNYALLHAFYVACIETNSFERKIKDCKCRAKKCTGTRIHACLSCVNFSCQEHIRTHAKKAKHRLFVDTDSGNIFCSRCKDYQYDFDFMRISEEQNFIAYQQRSAVFFQKDPNLQELELLSDCEVKFDSETDISNGLCNMNLVSCYMNVIVQSLIHAPIFRDYLLSCKHKCKNFQLDLKEAQKVNLCAFCEMITIVQKIFSGTNENYALGNLLYPFWLFLKRHNRLVGEPKTRDVQDFLEELLTLLHADSLKSEDDHENDFESSCCQCIIHRIFGLSLGYKKMCKNCPYVNESNGEFWSMPLGLDGLPELSLKCALERYTQEEEIEYFCNSCQTNSGCISKTYIKQLPLVLSFLLNTQTQLQGTYSRGTGSRGTRSRKKATNSETQDAVPVSFKCSEFLDMSPFVLPGTAEVQLECRFYLFCALIRKGDVNDGHFFCYVRLAENKWILCNDESVAPISLEEINFTDTRMLFYHREFVPYLKVVNDMVVQEESDMVVQGESDMVVQEESDMVVQEESDSVQ